MSGSLRNGRRLTLALLLVSALLAISFTATSAAGPPQPPPGLQRALEVQERNSLRLMTKKGVVGNGVGLSESGQPVIRVFTVQAGVAGIPKTLDGVPVEVAVTGEIFAMGQPAGKPDKPGKPPKPGDDPPTTVDPTDRFDRPVPIGVSTGAEWLCSAGTIGCRLFDLGSGEYYVLSNHHVYHGGAGINTIDSTPGYGPEADGIFQPARLDDPADDCVNTWATENNRIGQIVDFVSINFDGSGNTVDAAIGSVLNGTLDVGTPPADGYGVPSSVVVDAALGMGVQKYGRTTGLTHGDISVVGAEVWVSYGPGQVALFVDQITVTSKRAFLKPGDSGSLVVTDDDIANPVGLLFAGNRTGKIGTANRISDVLDAFDLMGPNDAVIRKLVVDDGVVSFVSE